MLSNHFGGILRFWYGHSCCQWPKQFFFFFFLKIRHSQIISWFMCAHSASDNTCDCFIRKKKKQIANNDYMMHRLTAYRAAMHVLCACFFWPHKNIEIYLCFFSTEHRLCLCLFEVKTKTGKNNRKCHCQNLFAHNAISICLFCKIKQIIFHFISGCIVPVSIYSIHCPFKQKYWMHSTWFIWLLLIIQFRLLTLICFQTQYV